MAEIKEAFSLFDTDNSGAIDYHELKVRVSSGEAAKLGQRCVVQVCMRALGFDVSKEEVERLMHEHGTDRGGEISFTAFESIMREKFADRDPKAEILKAFKLFDEENRGKIALRNLRHICHELGEALSEDELHAMIEEFDRDNDGEIDEQDFVAIMESTALY
jgi:centrin-3